MTADILFASPAELWADASIIDPISKSIRKPIEIGNKITSGIW